MYFLFLFECIECMDPRRMRMYLYTSKYGDSWVQSRLNFLVRRLFIYKLVYGYFMNEAQSVDLSVIKFTKT